MGIKQEEISSNMTSFQANIGFWGDVELLNSYELNDSFFDKGMELIPDDPFDLFLNVEDNGIFRSIHSDCKVIESGGCTSASDESETSEILESPNKYEIRNHDCMWSGNCVLNSIDGTFSCGYRQKSISSHQNKGSHHNAKSKNTMQNIPPGASLLLNQRNQMKKLEKFKIPDQTTSDFLKEREALPPPRPDTPVSLDDDTPEFKHSVDISACVMGSNNIHLEADKVFINKLKEQLEDTSSPNLDIDIIPGNKKRTLSEVLNVIGTVENDNTLCLDNDSDSESTSSSTAYKDSPSNQRSNYQPVMHSDHSYTRSKGGVDIIGLETPSDSDEEIDVVSIGDKKLPTNPSDKERRVIQSKVAHKISTRMVKMPCGIRTIPPRRRGSFDPSYSISALASQSKSVVMKHSHQTPIVHTNGGYSSIVNKYVHTGSRKRNTANAYKDEYIPPSKRYRNKNKRSSIKKHFDADEADTIEKRNLHNDMERQRRIGLKNLFEALKKQIPSIKDKERAPKVNILREAAKLCEQMTREDRYLTAQKLQLEVQLQRRQTQLKSSRSIE